jgi:hypothetical protein
MDYTKAIKRLIDRELERLEESYHDTNRTMYQIFASSKIIVHDNNFHTYCKPHLQNLPTLCAIELQSIRTQLESDEEPPYRPIQLDPLPEPTVPNYRSGESSSSLKLRLQWMKNTPPFMSDADADATYNEACAWMFRTSEPQPRNAVSPETAFLMSKSSNLRTQIADRAKSKLSARSNRHNSETTTTTSSAAMTPYEFNLRAMEGSDRTPYEPPGKIGTMEGSRSAASKSTFGVEQGTMALRY